MVYIGVVALIQSFLIYLGAELHILQFTRQLAWITGSLCNHHSLPGIIHTKQALDALKKKHFDVGIKKLLKIIDWSRQDVDKVHKFVNTIMGIPIPIQLINYY
ncbi:5471_t:CDS:2 [Entrophospora sp. SA101]|nr:5471_t:CDS:2 [Entrophospora sp. SA101]